MNSINYKFISRGSKYYPQAVDLRQKVFFKPSGLPITATLDEKENHSLHLVAIYHNQVVGYIRLTIQDDTAQFSQFVVDESMRGRANIGIILYRMLENKARESGVKKIVGNIRLPVAKSAKRFGFTVSDEVFPSEKTGIPHRRIEKEI